VGSGRNQDYEHDGISHWADDAGIILETLPNIKTLWPQGKQEIGIMVKEMLGSKEPYFISLRR
jgi:transketolase C-terminal domain/subunit